MDDKYIVFMIIGAALAMFIWQKVPAVIVAVCVALTLFFTGIVTPQEVLAGLGDPVVIMIAGLFVVGAGLEVSGVTTWAGQQLVTRASGSVNRAFILLCLLAALATATISVNGTVAALMPMVIVVAMRLGVSTSKLLMPLCFAAHSATMLTLLGAPLNIIASNTAMEAGYGGIGFFEFTLAGLPIFIGSVVIMLLTYRTLLPDTNGDSLPPDFSNHAKTLVEHYHIEDGLHRLRVRSTSPILGRPRQEVDLKDYQQIALTAIQGSQSTEPLKTGLIEEGDILLVRGPKEAISTLALDLHLAPRTDEQQESVADSMFNKNSGLAEVVIPPRSNFIGQVCFPGMTVSGGELMVLAIKRGGEDLGAKPIAVLPGDHILLQGSWAALDKHLADPNVLEVDSPELVRRQSVPLGHKAWEAIAVLVALVIMLVGGWFPAALVAVICAVALILLRVLTLPQAYKGIDWNTCILVGGLMPLATAMIRTGAADTIAETLISLVGGMGPRAVAAGLFFVTFMLSQVMSNTAAALIMLPISVVTGAELGLSSMPLIMAVTAGANAALLTPVATPVNLMIFGPGGYKFGDYWKFGLPIFAWWLVVVMFIIPFFWNFS